ncbi:uncharacterized protein MONBRDRAFT_12446 [Monosiga brevicollis MX1]|uniref:Uncharacterized protein n=1 Tax=Monosiga brevicollis TaxID=81824 RepID=A9VCA7_MONBE|nr:uncharacterized protein MONBRDRAFT_12446 [Monosiga brevicollis MX1]EDQ84867.1 predicted protein [Monosiga brevicollis MX1]|eukprot:XP_001750368.1 hypothetical protein [Monosiga brevicollis MX1]
MGRLERILGLPLVWMLCCSWLPTSGQAVDTTWPPTSSAPPLVINPAEDSGPTPWYKSTVLVVVAGVLAVLLALALLLVLLCPSCQRPRPARVERMDEQARWEAYYGNPWAPAGASSEVHLNPLSSDPQTPSHRVSTPSYTYMHGSSRATRAAWMAQLDTDEGTTTRPDDRPSGPTTRTPSPRGSLDAAVFHNVTAAVSLAGPRQVRRVVKRTSVASVDEDTLAMFSPVRVDVGRAEADEVGDAEAEELAFDPRDSYYRNSPSPEDWELEPDDAEVTDIIEAPPRSRPTFTAFQSTGDRDRTRLDPFLPLDSWGRAAEHSRAVRGDAAFANDFGGQDHQPSSESLAPPAFEAPYATADDFAWSETAFQL